jgi:hypothetical protein
MSTSNNEEQCMNEAKTKVEKYPALKFVEERGEGRKSVYGMHTDYNETHRVGWMSNPF